MSSIPSDPPSREEGQVCRDHAETRAFLESMRNQVRLSFFSPEDWFMAIHYALDGKTRASTSPAGSGDLQEFVRIPENNYQPMVMGDAGVPYPTGTST